MTEGDVVEIIRAGFVTTLIIAGPALAGALLVGLVISILQALTQVQEMTLAYIPKIVATLVLAMLFLPLSFNAIRLFFEEIFQRIVAI